MMMAKEMTGDSLLRVRIIDLPLCRQRDDKLLLYASIVPGMINDKPYFLGGSYR